jgi:hypothetical protein
MFLFDALLNIPNGVLAQGIASDSIYQCTRILLAFQGQLRVQPK